jgi:hypothetical protein
VGHARRRVKLFGVAVALLVPAWSERKAQCWAQPDGMMREIVPWAPMSSTKLSKVVSEHVVDSSPDKFANEPSLSRVALDGN